MNRKSFKINQKGSNYAKNGCLNEWHLQKSGYFFRPKKKKKMQLGSEYTLKIKQLYKLRIIQKCDHCI